MSQLFTSVTSGGAVPSNVPINFITDAGTAVSSSNNINVLGAGGTSTAGAGNTVTITTVATVFTWTDENANFTAAVNSGYFCTAALTALLPAAPTQGQQVILEIDTASAVIVQANAGQFIRMGENISSVAGSATSTRRGDTLNLVYRSSTQTWNSVSTEGTWTLA